MADTADRKHRKSVAFAEDETTISRDGSVTQTQSNGDKPPTAESHSDPPADVDEATQAFDDLALAKKKKKSKKPKADGEDVSADKEKDSAAAEDGADGDLDLTALKKKKKSKKVKTGEDFDSKLAKAGAAAEDGDADAPITKNEKDISAEEAGDMESGTGIWAHTATTPLPYNLLLSRFFTILNAHNPDLMSSSSKSTKIPPPQCLREGNKKTIFANIFEISKKMNRSDEHVAQFLFAELGTTGSVAADRRLVIKGKFMGKQIENVLLQYIKQYVQCKTCKAGPTDLVRGENRLYFIECQQCNSRRSVTNIKSGFRGQVGKRKRQQK
ncbi:MAG: hypothetical protein M1828_005650 [Chrysothrix sp. TS-e1954]|nr:MAG: hypothetical protein M1828_005650 [Chrysothrix sp. TS-e1954]